MIKTLDKDNWINYNMINPIIFLVLIKTLFEIRKIMKGAGDKMKIDNNPIEIEAMAAFRCGDGDEGNRLQDKFLSEFHDSLKRKEDFCPCTADCKHHGRCMDCVTIHRGHDDHLPNCLHAMLNRRIKKLSELSEHTLKVTED